MTTKTTGTQSEGAGSTLESELQRIVTDAVEEAHDEGIQHGSSGRRGSGPSGLPLVFVVGALGAAAILLWRRSRSGESGDGSGGIVERVQTTAQRAAERTDDATERAGERIDEGGETVAERTKELSEDAAQRVAEGGKTVAERTDEASGQAADRVEESGEEASSRMEDAAESADESSGAAGSR